MAAWAARAWGGRLGTCVAVAAVGAAAAAAGRRILQSGSQPASHPASHPASQPTDLQHLPFIPQVGQQRLVAGQRQRRHLQVRLCPLIHGAPSVPLQGCLVLCFYETPQLCLAPLQLVILPVVQGQGQHGRQARQNCIPRRCRELSCGNASRRAAGALTCSAPAPAP